MFDSEEIGFVICSKCGARIRADREWCLRCHEPLVAWKKAEIPLPPVVRALGGGTLIFGLVGVAAAAVIIYLTFFDSSAAQPDRPLQRSTQPVASTTAAPAAARTQATSHIEQLQFVDTPRRSSVDVADAELPAARTRFEQALQSNPKDADTLNSLGLVLERLGFVESAITRFATAVDADRRNWIFHFNLAHASSLQQNWNRAAAEYAAVLELFPDNYAAQYDMAVALHMSSNEPAAIRAYEKAIQMAPGDPAAHLSFALSLEASGRSDDAVSEYRRYLEMVPTAPNAAAVTQRIQNISHES